MLTVAFGESTMSRTQVQLWYNRFKEGREDVNGDARPARQQPMITLKQWRKWFWNNRRITITEVSFGSCQAIFTNVLGMKRAAAKIVPKLLNFEQKQRRMDIALELLTTFNDDTDLLKKYHNWRRIMGEWLWHWNQSPIILMEASRRSKTEKSTSSSVKCESFVRCFLRL